MRRRFGDFVEYDKESENSSKQNSFSISLIYWAIVIIISTFFAGVVAYVYKPDIRSINVPVFKDDVSVNNESNSIDDINEKYPFANCNFVNGISPQEQMSELIRMVQLQHAAFEVVDYLEKNHIEYPELGHILTDSFELNCEFSDIPEEKFLSHDIDVLDYIKSYKTDKNYIIRESDENGCTDIKVTPVVLYDPFNDTVKDIVDKYTNGKSVFDYYVSLKNSEKSILNCVFQEEIDNDLLIQNVTAPITYDGDDELVRELCNAANDYDAKRFSYVFSMREFFVQYILKSI